MNDTWNTHGCPGICYKGFLFYKVSRSWPKLGDDGSNSPALPEPMEELSNAAISTSRQVIMPTPGLCKHLTLTPEASEYHHTEKNKEGEGKSP